MGLAIVIMFIVFIVGWILFQRWKEGKEDRDYIKGKKYPTDDIRDISERWMDDEPFRQYFNHKP